MGGLIFAFMAGLYYWLPKVMGIRLNERLGQIQFWTMFIAFNSTFLPLFAVGMAGQPRRVFEYANDLTTLNDWVSISSFVLGASIAPGPPPSPRLTRQRPRPEHATLYFRHDW